MNAVPPEQGMVHCRACGHTLHASALACPSCGARQPGSTDRRILPAAVLCFFFGIFGAHRFYVGKIGTGILQLLTFGGLGIWATIDFILIVVGAFKDRDGCKITLWT